MGPGAGDGKHSAAGTKDGGGGSSLPQELLGKSCSLNAGALGSAVDEVGGIIIVPKTRRRTQGSPTSKSPTSKGHESLQ